MVPVPGVEIGTARIGNLLLGLIFYFSRAKLQNIDPADVGRIVHNAA
jgi:hypothetical protein